MSLTQAREFEPAWHQHVDLGELGRMGAEVRRLSGLGGEGLEADGAGYRPVPGALEYLWVKVTADAGQSATSAVKVAAGSGYAVGDTITLSGGTSTAKAVLAVTSLSGTSGVGTVAVLVRGAYSAVPTNPVSQLSSSGSGSGATFTLTWTHYYSWEAVVPDGNGGFVSQPANFASDASGALPAFEFNGLSVTTFPTYGLAWVDPRGAVYFYADLAQAASPGGSDAVVKVTSLTKTGSYYPCKVEAWSDAGSAWSDGADAWFLPANGETPLLNSRYLGAGVATRAADGRTVYAEDLTGDYSYSERGATNLTTQVAKGRKFFATGVGWTPDSASVGNDDYTLVRENWLLGSNPALSFRKNVTAQLVDVRAKSLTHWTSYGGVGPYDVMLGPTSGGNGYGSSLKWTTVGSNPTDGEGGAGAVSGELFKFTVGFGPFSGDDLAFGDAGPEDTGNPWMCSAGYVYGRLGFATDDGGGTLKIGTTSGMVDGSLFYGGICTDQGGLFGSKPTVTGSRGGNAALASALTALAGLGLITNSSTP